MNRFFAAIFLIVGLSVRLSPALAAPAASRLTISSPSNGQKFATSTPVKVRVAVAKSVGGIRSLKILRNGKAAKTFTHAPFRLRWRKLKAGSYTVQAKAVTASGKRLSSKSVAFTIGGSVSPNPDIPGGTTHPRMWLTTNDLPHLREWAKPSNPVFVELQHLADQMAAKVTGGEVPGTCVDQNHDGTPDNAWDAGTGLFDSGNDVTEMHAHLFAFMSLIEPDATKAAQYKTWAHDLVMAMVNQGQLGTYDEASECVNTGHTKTSCYCREKKRFRDQRRQGSSDLDYFLTGDRGFAFDGLPTAIDWVYDSFTSEEKSVIRKAFLNWIQGPLTRPFEYSPTPVWTLSDPALFHLSDPYLSELRFAANNHYLSYMRAIGLMALTLDSADDQGDPDAQGHNLRDYIANVVNAWLYMTDYSRRNDSPGGLSPEGSMYSDLGLKFEMQFRLALLTSGLADENAWGPHVGFYDHPFWDKVVPAYLHQLPPTPVVKENWQGPVYETAWYGDGQYSYQPDVTGFLGMVAAYDQENGLTDRVEQIRWAIKNTLGGGSDKWLTRLASTYSNIRIRDAVFTYLVFDPSAAEAADPRSSLDKEFFVSGLGRLLARTGWDAASRMISYKLGFNRIDHNHEDGNMFEFWRKGQWLTKKWVGYGRHVGYSDYNNTLTIQNYCGGAGGQYDSNAYNYADWQIGSQFELGSGSATAYAAHSAANWQDKPMDPKVRALSMQAGAAYVAVTGDSTELYNHYNQYNSAQTCGDVQHASRSLVWLKPDYVVVYDRAKTGHSGFKRFWLNLQTQPAVSVDNATASTLAQGATTDGTQKLAVRTLLPAPAGVTVTSTNARPDGGGYDETAQGEILNWRLEVSANGNPAETRFLHVLQGLDSGDSPSAATLVQSSGGKAFEGAALNHTVVLFAKDLQQAFSSFSYTAPSGTATHLISGLSPNTPYTINRSGNQITVSAGGSSVSDDGGVLSISLNVP